MENADLKTTTLVRSVTRITHSETSDLWYGCLIEIFRSNNITTESSQWRNNHILQCSTDSEQSKTSSRSREQPTHLPAHNKYCSGWSRYNQGNILKSHLWGQNDDLSDNVLIKYRLLSVSKTEMKYRKWRKHKLKKMCSHKNEDITREMKHKVTTSAQCSLKIKQTKKTQIHHVAQISITHVSKLTSVRLRMCVCVFVSLFRFPCVQAVYGSSCTHWCKSEHEYHCCHVWVFIV